MGMPGNPAEVSPADADVADQQEPNEQDNPFSTMVVRVSDDLTKIIQALDNEPSVPKDVTGKLQKMLSDYQAILKEIATGSSEPQAPGAPVDANGGVGGVPVQQ